MTNSHDYAIRASGLKKAFKGATVLDGVDLAVPEGTMLALLGPNGAGKTTTVRILSTLLPFDGGEATVGGYDVAREPGGVRHVLGLTGQYASVDEILTGRENLVMIGRLYHLGRARARDRADQLLHQFNLADAADRAVKTYSGGMRRRLDLAASLIAAPPIIFLDEPTTGLDPRSRQQMWDVIRDLLRGGTTILLTTQYLEEADQLADRVAVIDDGRIIADGTAAELKERVGTERVELTFASADDARAALHVVDRTDTAHLHDDATRLSLPVDAPDDVRHVLNALAAASVPVNGIGLSKPSLDDVFFTLTGTHAPHPPTPAEDGTPTGARPGTDTHPQTLSNSGAQAR
ncbi:ATP-binding cassette domain-containing protein [Phytoactinopolyspora halotolerans]|uniref:ATP-binding cassette domain-containing protein n=1 Tax=Phytoactinopolyspora halotolerans TaxID=1981512 RepID=UPI001C209F87|nr:ATP-binding cassette domain-containing protein [Phytoactinopolyspora halotolerans]